MSTFSAKRRKLFTVWQLNCAIYLYYLNVTMDAIMLEMRLSDGDEGQNEQRPRPLLVAVYIDYFYSLALWLIKKAKLTS